MTQPLALDSAPAGQAAGWRKGEDLIDALPYVDRLTPEEKMNVDRLIQEEMKNSSQRPAAYLKDLPPAYQLNFADHPILSAEMERVKEGVPMNTLDDVRYQLNPPPKAQRNSFAAWKEALDNAHSQIGHQHNRVVNLELLLKFGPKAWRVHNTRLSSSNARLEAEVALLRSHVDAVNRERKLQQTAAGSNLVALETQWQTLVAKNAQIERACQALERDIAAAKAQPPIASSGESGEGIPILGVATISAEVTDAEEAAMTNGPTADEAEVKSGKIVAADSVLETNTAEDTEMQETDGAAEK